MFRVMGDVLDIFPADSDNQAIRIELFDDEVENISFFDPLTGEIIRKVRQVTVFPKTHYVTPRDVMLNAIDLIKNELSEHLIILTLISNIFIRFDV